MPDAILLRMFPGKEAERVTGFDDTQGRSEWFKRGFFELKHC
jgi:hypothetical protein